MGPPPLGVTHARRAFPIYYKRHDGLPNRPLPLDRDMQVKPMYAVASEFITRCGA
jgi:GH35 family endo-1,4-beta-xylanase